MAISGSNKWQLISGNKWQLSMDIPSDDDDGSKKNLRTFLEVWSDIIYVGLYGT